MKKECPVITAFIAGHVSRSRYKLEIRKCGKDECKFCKPVRMEAGLYQKLVSRPALVPLPYLVGGIQAMKKTEGKNQDNIQKFEQIPADAEYLPYEECVDLVSDHRFLPSYKPPEAPSEEAKAIDAKRKWCIGSKGNKVNIFDKKFICCTVTCQSCNKPRLVFSPPALAENINPKLVALKSIFEEPHYDYQCGDDPLGLDGDEFADGNLRLQDMFFVRRAQTCAMVVEKIYYSCNKFPIVCCHCGEEETEQASLVTTDDDGNSVFPICHDCKDGGKKLVTRGQKNRVNTATETRKCGAARVNKETTNKAARMEAQPAASSTQSGNRLADPVVMHQPEVPNTNSTDPVVLDLPEVANTSKTPNQDGIPICHVCTNPCPSSGYQCEKCRKIIHCPCGRFTTDLERRGAPIACLSCLGLSSDLGLKNLT